MAQIAKRVHQYSPREEVANSVTHGIGVMLAIAALGVLATFSGLFGNVWHIVSVCVYGTTLVLLYTASTLYHSIQHPGAKSILQTLDHSAIFLLIAGTYTPFTLVSLRGPWGWSLFGVIWGLAVCGVLFELTNLKHGRTVAIILYICMGWAVIIAFKPLIENVATGGVVFLALGGLAYTSGLLFYGQKKLKYHHAVWHLFVLAGSILHFFAILFYVLPEIKVR